VFSLKKKIIKFGPSTGYYFSKSEKNQCMRVCYPYIIIS